jgi:predicted nucleic acid-binding protein
VTPDRVDNFIKDLAKFAEPVENVPALFSYSRDPDDAHYVDLAIATGARLLVSRDKDLLDLMDESRVEGKDFRKQFPDLIITDPPSFLLQLDELK